MAMTDISSEIQCAELEIREALKERPGEALSHLMQAYDGRDQSQKEAFTMAVIGHLVSLSVVSKRESVSPYA